MHQPPRERRETTQDDSNRSLAQSMVGAKPADRKRRASAKYDNVEAYENLGAFMAEYQAMRQAIDEDKVFSGSRDDVGWSNGFARKFWTATDLGGGTWACATADAGVCLQPAAAPGHAVLEIGHKTGFYSIVASEVDTVVVCDGANHWLVMPLRAVVTANELMWNLEPQCNQCNRLPQQQAKDDRGKGKYQPERQGACPDPAGCRVTKVDTLKPRERAG